MKLITIYLAKLFKNNGVARGWLYIINCFGTVVLADLTILAAVLKDNPDFLNHVSPIVYLVFIAKSLIQGVVLSSNTIRAYIDQHLSRKPEPPEPPKSE